MRISRGFLRTLLGIALLTGAIVALGRPAGAQRGGMMMPLTPDLKGVWNPVVGSGASYHEVDKGVATDVEILIVGKEDVDGRTGYWVELGSSVAPMGEIYAKSLIVMGDKNYTADRIIFQMPGRPPIEMPTGAQNPAPATSGDNDIRDHADLVGTEDVATPAGTFSCTHYRDKQGKWGDVWLSTKVTPWGLVKSVGGDRTVMLTRVISNAPDHITGTPQPFDPSSIMQLGRGK
jgi:hypothetical protein